MNYISLFFDYFLLFFIYSVLGWVMESIYVSSYSNKFVNRGFLIGPYCPIYGCGALIMIFYLTQYQNNILTVFILGVVICAILEYFTSYIMEKIFKARWWDYSHKKYNINGRICLDNIVAFGVLGLLMMYLINPFVLKFLGYVDIRVLNIVSIILGIVFIVDSIISFKVITGFKKVAKTIKKDSTEEITKKVREILSKRGVLYKRLVSAFDFEASDKLIKDIKSKVKNVKDDLDDYLKESKKKRVQKKNELISEYRNKVRKMNMELNKQKEELIEKIKKLK